MTTIGTMFNTAVFQRQGISVANKPIPAETIQKMRGDHIPTATPEIASVSSNPALADTTMQALLAAQEEPSAGTKSYDFSNMSRQEIADAGKALFKEGKITIDELFRFDHPDGKLRIAADGSPANLNPNDRINFIGHTEQAISNMEATGEAWKPKSAYGMMLGLLAKLTEFSGQAG